MIGRALTLTHTGFGRLLGYGLVWKQTNPDLAAPLDETRHCHAAGFDLPVRNPARLEHLQPILAERKFRAAPGLPSHASALLLAVLNFFRHQHNQFPGRDE